MVKKYKFLRVDLETMKKLDTKKMKINQALCNLGTKGKITKIKLISLFASKPLYLTDGEIKNLGKEKRRKI